MFSNCKNSLQQGAIGLARAIYEYQKIGYTVCLPLVDGQDYDLVIGLDGKFQSVQCRTTSRRAKPSCKFYTVNLRTIKTNCSRTVCKNRGIYDLLFVLCDDGSCYSIPAINLKQSLVTLNQTYEIFRII